MEYDKNLPNPSDQVSADTDLAVIPTGEQPATSTVTVHAEDAPAPQLPPKKSGGVLGAIGRFLGITSLPTTAAVLPVVPVNATPTSQPEAHNIIMTPPAPPMEMIMPDPSPISLAPVEEERLLPPPEQSESGEHRIGFIVPGGTPHELTPVPESTSTLTPENPIIPPPESTPPMDQLAKSEEQRNNNEAYQLLQPLKEVLDIEHNAQFLDLILSLSNQTAEEQSKKLKVETQSDGSQRISYYQNGYDNPMMQPDILLINRTNQDGSIETTLEFYVAADAQIHPIPAGSDQMTFTSEQLKAIINQMLNKKDLTWTDSTSILIGGIVAKPYQSADHQIAINDSGSGIVLVKITTSPKQ